LLPVASECEHYAADERAALAIATTGGALPAGSAHEAFSTARQFFTDEQLLEIVAAVAAFGWFNRWNSLTRSQLEDVPAEALQHVAWLRQLNPGP
jgi:alkylhydroperoxidase family enzyme